MNIYVGNLPFNLSEDELRSTFAAYGAVTSATVIKDQFTGQSRGFGFVEMSSSEEATAAINALNGKEVKGRALKVNEARPREERRPGGGGSSSGQRRPSSSSGRSNSGGGQRSGW